MASVHDADCIIVGAGCAGLSLAVHLLERGTDLRVLLLEPRTEYVRDRTWCFWNVESHPFEACVDHRWDRWRVRSSREEHLGRSERYVYHHLPSDTFYDHALARVDAAPNVTLQRGVRVTSIDEGEDGVRVGTSAGELHAPVVLDSRPPRWDGPVPPGEVRFLQHFRGWVVRTDRPAFDPGECTLMDFDVDQSDGIHFVYTLPFDAHTALVEDTWFSPSPWGWERYERELERYLGEHIAGGYQVLHTEGGVLPMTTEPLVPAVGKRVHRIGLAGGLAKPSTGYAFLFIQRHCRALARELGGGGLPRAAPPRDPWTRMLDRVFLWVLEERPEQAPDLFLQLFRRTPDDVVVRFLCEASTRLDDLRVMASLPPTPFTRAAWRARHLWMRAR